MGLVIHQGNTVVCLDDKIIKAIMSGFLHLLIIVFQSQVYMVFTWQNGKSDHQLCQKYTVWPDEGSVRKAIVEWSTDWAQWIMVVAADSNNHATNKKIWKSKLINDSEGVNSVLEIYFAAPLRFLIKLVGNSSNGMKSTLTLQQRFRLNFTSTKPATMTLYVSVNISDTPNSNFTIQCSSHLIQLFWNSHWG